MVCSYRWHDYRFYHATALVPADEKKFYEIRLSDTRVSDAVIAMNHIAREREESGLNDLWSAHSRRSDDRRVQKALVELMSIGSKAIIDLIHDRAQSLSPKAIAESLGRLSAITDGEAVLNHLVVGRDMNAEIKKAKENRGNFDRSMSCVDAAVRVLSEEGKPMTTGAMIEVMARKGYWTPKRGGKTPAATLSTRILLAERGSKSRIKKVARGLYDLTAYGKQSVL
jgi:hypothetical protein